MRKFTLLFIAVTIIAIALLCSCIRPNLEAADTSTRTFTIEHFNGSVQERRNLSAFNSQNIFYIDGTLIYKYGEEECFLNITKELTTIAVSEHYLYLLYSDNTLEEYNIASSEVDSMDNIINIAVDKNNVFFCKSTGGAFFSEEGDLENAINISDMICSGQPYGETDGYFDIYATTIAGSVVYCDAVTLNKDGKLIAAGEIYVICNDQPQYIGEFGPDRMSLFIYSDGIYSISEYAYIVATTDGMVKSVENLQYSDYYGNDRNKFINGSIVYQLLQLPIYTNPADIAAPLYTFNFPQNHCVKDCLIATDLEKEETYIVYQTDNNLNRIIGFNDETVYLFDVNEYKVSARNLRNGKQKDISIVSKLDNLRFEWCQDILFVYDDFGNVVDIVDFIK